MHHLPPRHWLWFATVALLAMLATIAIASGHDAVSQRTPLPASNSPADGGPNSAARAEAPELAGTRRGPLCGFVPN